MLLPGKKQQKKDNPAPGAPERTLIVRTPKGWMTSIAFLKYMKDMFVPYIQQHDIPLPVVLLIDGHPSHKTPEVGEYCREQGIILYKLPAHSTHLLQPCDVSIFKSMKAAWYRAEREYRRKRMDFVTKSTFPAAFKPAWDRVTANPSLAVNGFREAGIYPFTREYRRESLKTASVFVRPPPIDVDDDDADADSALIYIGSSADEEPTSPYTIIAVEELESPAAVTISDFLGCPTIPYNPKRRRDIEPDAISGEEFLRKASEKRRKKEEEEEKKKQRKEEREERKREKEREVAKRGTEEKEVECQTHVGLEVVTKI